MSVPDFAELVEHAHVLALPLRTRFRGLEERETLVLRGPAGWTEFAPFVEYDDAEAVEWLRAAIAYGWDASLASGASRVRVNATVPAVEPGAVSEVLARFPGCRTAKVKVAGGPLANDVDRVRAVRDHLGAEGRIRVDANGAWTIDEAERAIRALAPLDLDYVEQPCATVGELAELRDRIADLGVWIAADESVRRSSDPLAVARAEAADLLVIKVAPLGGVRRAERIIAEAGLPVVVSSALESAIGLGMGTLLASRLPNVEDAGLGTAMLMRDDVASRAVVDGFVSTTRVEPDTGALGRLAAAPGRRDWWMDRLQRCWALLADAD